MRNSFSLVLTIVLIQSLTGVSRAADEMKSFRHERDGGFGDRPPVRLETPGDSPGEPATEIELPAAVWTRGQYVSVQVNVAANGGDIIFDAANEPSITIDPTNPDVIAIGWRQFDTIGSNFREAGWSYSHDGGQTWTFPGVIQKTYFEATPFSTPTRMATSTTTA